MTGLRTSRRTFAAIFQVVAFLALSVFSAGHAQSGVAVHPHAAVERPASVDHAAVTVLPAALDQTALPDAPAPVCGADCCHAHPMRPACPAVAHHRTFERVLAGARAVPFASVVPERQAEPPRPFA